MSTPVYTTVAGLDDVCDAYVSIDNLPLDGASKAAIKEGFLATVTENTTGTLQAATASVATFSPIYVAYVNERSDEASDEAAKVSRDALIAALPA